MDKRSKDSWEPIIYASAIVSVLVVIAIIVGASIGSSSAKIINKAKDSRLDYLIVVNDKNSYEFGGEYDEILQQDLVYPPDVYGEATPVERATAVAFSELSHALAKQGMIIGLYSAYRTKENQQAAYDYYSNLEGWSETNKITKPGYSEHHTGLLLNIVIWYQGEEDGVPIWYTESAERQKAIPYFKLLHETLADYGFIDRYPAGKEDITGVPCEPYEIRFVGSKDVAHKIMDNGLTLEEYIAQG